MKKYVISLPNATERREHILKEFSKKNINVEFFDAFSPSERMHKAINTLIPSLSNNQTLSNGEKGCLLSHLALWEKCVSENVEFICIFEDDVILSDNCHHFLNDAESLIGLLKDNNTIIKIETFLMPVEINEENAIPCRDRELVKLMSVHYGTAGYIINKACAEMLLSKFYLMKSSEIEAIDQVIFNKLLNCKEINIYQMIPAICVQELQLTPAISKLNSQIEPDRKSLSDKSKPNFIMRILGTYSRRKKRKEEERKRLERNYKIIEFI